MSASLFDYFFFLLVSILPLPSSLSGDPDHGDSISNQVQYSQPAPSSLPLPNPAATVTKFDRESKGKSPMAMDPVRLSPLVSLSHKMVSSSRPVLNEQAEPEVTLEAIKIDVPPSSSSLFASSSSLSSTREATPEPAPPWKQIKHQNHTSRNSTLALNLSSTSRTEQQDADHHLFGSFHPVIEMLRELELGKHILVLAVPMSIGLVSIYKPDKAHLAMTLTAVCLSLGVVAIWNGLLLRKTFHETSNVIELVGIAFMLLAFFGIVACFLPLDLIWVPFVCWILSLVPFGIAFCFRGRANRNVSSPTRPPV